MSGMRAIFCILFVVEEISSEYLVKDFETRKRLALKEFEACSTTG